MAEEKEFQVIDKRRIRREPPPEESPPPPEKSAAEEETAEEEKAEGEKAGEEKAGEEKAAAESPAGGSSAAAAPEAAAPETGEEEEGPYEPIEPANAAHLVTMCINMLHEVAWVKMGMVPDPLTGTLETDLAQARLAIDSVSDLVHRLESHADPRMRRDLEVLVQNLKMNFVRKSTENPGD